ncbi:hypothetical protein K438DRAFT_76287 [Mycena galopus ATCC 62051]|nr:hypothetical protein K438DRAFT_76287 [Mycena galopus ATCC 62051]
MRYQAFSIVDQLPQISPLNGLQRDCHCNWRGWWNREGHRAQISSRRLRCRRKRYIPEVRSLGRMVDGIKAKGRASSFHVADVSLEEEVRGMVEAAVNDYGRLDVMVANAGVSSRTSLSEMTTDQWDRMMNINARGTFLCYKYAGIQMIKQGGGGRIIGASSIAGKQGSPFNFAYTASKFAVRGLTQAAALEFGAHGITVNAYAPGAVDTEMLSYVMPLDTPRDVLLGAMKQGSPLNTVGTPTDIADFVSFIASKESGFITGQTVCMATSRYAHSLLFCRFVSTAESISINFVSFYDLLWHRVSCGTGVEKWNHDVPMSNIIVPAVGWYESSAV